MKLPEFNNTMVVFLIYTLKRFPFLHISQTPLKNVKDTMSKTPLKNKNKKRKEGAIAVVY